MRRTNERNILFKVTRARTSTHAQHILDEVNINRDLRLWWEEYAEASEIYYILDR